MSGPIRLRFRVAGRVQGVGFRYYVLRAAERHGIAGLVRNCPDGSVEAEGEGEASALAAFEIDLRLGPPASRVTGVTADKIALVGSADFRIVS